MTPYLYRIISFIKHYLTSTNTLGHGVHSPYLYNLVRFNLYDTNKFYCFGKIEKERMRLLRANREIYVEDYGTGTSGNRRVCDVAEKSLSSPKEGQKLFRLTNYIKPSVILELGTSLGISTAYLASSNSRSRVVTLEGSEAIASQAANVFNNLGLTNITQVIGSIDGQLPLVLKNEKKIDVAFIDANHTFDATMRYFNMLKGCVDEKSVIILDDIYYTKEMNRAWRAIMSDDMVTSTMDFYDFGIVFFDKHYLKKHYKMRL